MVNSGAESVCPAHSRRIRAGGLSAEGGKPVRVERQHDAGADILNRAPAVT